MSTDYVRPEDVSTERIVARLRELSDAITKGKDADLVLDIAAKRLEIKVSESEALGALRYLMDRFDNENWQCPKCGHAESTSTMDSADWLRGWFERILK